jgi:hypothetical protein
MKVVVFLQNAWSPHYAGRTWPRISWLKALAKSRSGQRLNKLIAIARDVEWWFDNTTPIVGATPDSVVKPDAAHIEKVLREQKPDVVVLLGEQAARAVLPVCKKPCLVMPHPANRVLTNVLYELGGRLLATKFQGVWVLKQERGLIDARRYDTASISISMLFGATKTCSTQGLGVSNRSSQSRAAARTAMATG